MKLPSTHHAVKVLMCLPRAYARGAYPLGMNCILAQYFSIVNAQNPTTVKQILDKPVAKSFLIMLLRYFLCEKTNKKKIFASMAAALIKVQKVAKQLTW